MNIFTLSFLNYHLRFTHFKMKISYYLLDLTVYLNKLIKRNLPFKSDSYKNPNFIIIRIRGSCKSCIFFRKIRRKNKRNLKLHCHICM